MRALLDRLEAALSSGEEAHAEEVLAFVAGRGLELDPGEVRAARRRAVQLLAAGGDPLRGLDVDGRAVRALADDLDGTDRRAELTRGLHHIRRQAEGLTLVTAVLQVLEQEPDRAWRRYACGLLAEELAAEDDEE